MNPLAAFDVLAIARRVEPILGDVTHAEFHLFSYLACLLWVYKGNPATDWGYGFAGTVNGSPHSPEIEQALTDLEHSGYLNEVSQRSKLTADGRAEYDELKTLGLNGARDRYIDGACGTALAFPAGLVRDALAREPALRRASQTGQARLLLQSNEEQASVYAAFSVLTQAIGVAAEDLMVPAVVWIECLLRAELPVSEATET